MTASPPAAPIIGAEASLGRGRPRLSAKGGVGAPPPTWAGATTSGVWRLTACVVLAAVTVLGGCATGNGHSYTGTTPELAVSGTRVAVVAVRDARPYVVSGNKTANFVGRLRGGSGNPVDILTESGNPLAVDFETTIVAALRAQGFKASVLPGTIPTASEDIAAAVARAGAERMVALVLLEWASDIFVNTELDYDVALTVYDAAGKGLGATRLTGRENLGGDAANPPRHAKAAVPVAYRKILEHLFSVQPIIMSLQ